MNSVITLITDFGIADAYVRATKDGSAASITEAHFGDSIKIRVGA